AFVLYYPRNSSVVIAGFREGFAPVEPNTPVSIHFTFPEEEALTHEKLFQSGTSERYPDLCVDGGGFGHIQSHCTDRREQRIEEGGESSNWIRDRAGSIKSAG